jgi:hypothetical protein
MNLKGCGSGRRLFQLLYRRQLGKNGYNQEKHRVRSACLQVQSEPSPKQYEVEVPATTTQLHSVRPRSDENADRQLCRALYSACTCRTYLTHGPGV